MHQPTNDSLYRSKISIIPHWLPTGEHCQFCSLKGIIGPEEPQPEQEFDDHCPITPIFSVLALFCDPSKYFGEYNVIITSTISG